MKSPARSNACILALAILACSLEFIRADPSACQTPPQDNAAKPAPPGVILGELHFARRNDKGEWVRDPRRFATDAANAPKKDLAPTKRDSVKPPQKAHDKPDFEAGFGEIVRSYLELEELARSGGCDYVSGTSEAAIWEFKRLPETLAQRGQVKIRLRYELFRTIKFFDGLAQADVTFINREKWTGRRADEYRRQKASPSEKLAKPDALAREFGIFERKGAQLDANGKQPLVLTFPASLLADLKSGTLEVRVQCLTQGVYAGFHSDDLVIVYRP
jgi:hypothetical protein